METCEISCGHDGALASGPLLLSPSRFSCIHNSAVPGSCVSFLLGASGGLGRRH